MWQDGPGGRLDAEPPRWRFFDLSYDTGARHAALTEALLRSVAVGGRPVVRVYSWTEPTVFIGVGEPSGDVDRPYCAAHGIPIVRRLSGGTVVRHDDCWVSVELIAPSGRSLMPTDVLGAYQAFASPIAGALARLGIVTHIATIDEVRSRARAPRLAACFADLAPFEVVSHDRKLVGLAQVRKRGVCVLHAAIGLRFDVGALLAVLADRDPSIRRRLASVVTDVAREAGWPVAARDITQALRQSFMEWLRDPLEADRPTPEEQAAAGTLVGEKYANPAWTFRR